MLQTTLDVEATCLVDPRHYPPLYEIFVHCRKCLKTSIFTAYEKMGGRTSFGELAGYFINGDFITAVLPPIIRNAQPCPEHVPVNIKALFDEAAKCNAVDCYDAAGTMFRKVLDAATRDMITGEPQTLDKDDPDYIAWKTYKDLGLRLGWLFSRNRLPLNLQSLAACVHQDGNDAAHDTNGIGKLEAEDLEDFTMEFLLAVYTLPGRVADSARRRAERRQ